MTYNATQRISAFFLALVLALAAWTCVEAQEPPFPSEWAEKIGVFMKEKENTDG